MKKKLFFEKLRFKMVILDFIQQFLTYIIGFLTIVFSPQIIPPNNFNGTCPEGFLGDNCEIGKFNLFIF